MEVDRFACCFWSVVKHEELDEAFQKLRAEQAAELRGFHELKVARLDELERKLSAFEGKFKS